MPTDHALPSAQEPYRPIGSRESIYLDLIRSLAAFAVVLDHAPSLFDLPNMPRLGHQAVITFFVISGYVICNTADTRERTLRMFLVARFARLWSVLVPAVGLTIVCDVIGRSFGHNPSAYAGVPMDLPVVRIGAVLAFLSETWVSIQPLSNGVVWSLCVEFWYYMAFAAWVFLAPGRRRTVALTAAALLGGHKGLLLSPIWLMGVALQRSRLIRRLPVAASFGLWFAGIAVVVAVIVTHGYDPPILATAQLVGPWASRQLAQARVFWFDWLFGLAIAAHLLGARTVMQRLPLAWIAKPVRVCASVSFAAYLFHMPLLTLCAAFLPRQAGWPAIGLTLIAIGLLGFPAERSKGWWRDRLRRIVGGRLAIVRREPAIP